MSTPMYPSLSTHAGALTDPKEIIPSILRHMFASPPSISDAYENKHYNHRISFRRLMGLYGHDPQVFCTKYQEELNTVFGRYFNGRQIEVSTYYRYINDITGELEVPTSENIQWVRYTVFLDIQERLDDGTLVPLIVSSMVSINQKTYEFTINFEGAQKNGRA